MMRDRPRPLYESSRQREAGPRASGPEYTAAGWPRAPQEEHHSAGPALPPPGRSPSRAASDSSVDSSSLLDISRHYPVSGRLSSILSTFFRAPSSRTRRRHRRAVAVRPRTLLPFGNSSSSSVNSDLAYGDGFIPRTRRRRESTDHFETYEAFPHAEPMSPRRRRQLSSSSRSSYQTRPRGMNPDQDILHLGRQLSDLAQNPAVRAGGGSSLLRSRADHSLGVRDQKQSRARHTTEGREGVTAHFSREDPGNDLEWESASDEETSDDANSQLAYGSMQPPAFTDRPPSAAAASIGGTTKYRGLVDSQKGWQSFVPNPRPSSPVGPLRSRQTSAPADQTFEDRGMKNPPRRQQQQTHEDSKALPPLREVLTIPTADSDKFEAQTVPPVSSQPTMPSSRRYSQLHTQQPIPRVPMSVQLHQAERIDRASRPQASPLQDPADSRRHGLSTFTEVAAASAAALAFSRKSRREERRRAQAEQEKGVRRIARQSVEPTWGIMESKESPQQVDGRNLGQDATGFPGRRSNLGAQQQRSQSDLHETTAAATEDDKNRLRRRSTTGHGAAHGSDQRSETFSKRKADDIGKTPVLVSEVAKTSASPVDPFRHQIHESGAWRIPDQSLRPLTPSIVTCDEEPVCPESIAHIAGQDQDATPERPVEVGRRRRMSYDGGARSLLHSQSRLAADEYMATEILEQAKHFTAPSTAAAVASTIAVEARTSRRPNELPPTISHKRPGSINDDVQRNANVFYREAIIARKVAADEINSKDEVDRSIIDKWEVDDSEDLHIATPPAIEERSQADVQSRYEKPNADVRIDNRMYPNEAQSQRPFASPLRASPPCVRDPSCERDRPVINLIYPTPNITRQSSPMPIMARKHKDMGWNDETSQSAVVASSAVKEASEDTSPDVSVSSPPSPVREQMREQMREQTTPIADQGIPKIPDSTRVEDPCTMRPSGVAVKKATHKLPIESYDESAENLEHVHRDNGKFSVQDSTITAIGPDQVFLEEAVNEPPIPGPKPAGPQSKQMPGAFADDVEFLATVAAGLADSGFDPNIVIEDPLFQRRSSPSGPSGIAAEPEIFLDASTGWFSGFDRPSMPEPGFVIGEIETPTTEMPVSRLENPEAEDSTCRPVKMRESTQSEASPVNQLPETDTSSPRAQFPQSHSLDSSMSRDESKGAEVGSTLRPSEPEEIYCDTKRLNSDETGTMDRQGAVSEKDAQPCEDVQGTAAPKKLTADDERNERRETFLPQGAHEKSKSIRRKVRKNLGKVEPEHGREIASRDAETLAPGQRGDNRGRDSRGNSAHLCGPEASRRTSNGRAAATSTIPISASDEQSPREHPSADETAVNEQTEGGPPASGLLRQENIPQAGGSVSSALDHDLEPKGSDSFLADADSLGAGVGNVDSKATSTDEHGYPITTDNLSEVASPRLPTTQKNTLDAPDLGVSAYLFRPAIDPQYGDLLPLPPTKPGASEPAPHDLPELPDSRPDTPPEERFRNRDSFRQYHRRNPPETPVKSPSSTAIPFSLRLNQRGSPSASNMKAMRSPTPRQSPISSTSLENPRPMSWDGSREMKPLYLLTHSRQNSLESALQGAKQDESGMEPLWLEGASRRDHVMGQVRIERRLKSGPAGLEDVICRDKDESPQEAVPSGRSSFAPSTQAKEEQDRAGESPAPEPDPVESMSKNRSSFLLHSTKSSLESAEAICPRDICHSNLKRAEDVGAEEETAGTTLRMTTCGDTPSDAEGTNLRPSPDSSSLPDQGTGSTGCEYSAQSPSDTSIHVGKQSNEKHKPPETGKKPKMTAKEKRKAKKSHKAKATNSLSADAGSDPRTETAFLNVNAGPPNYEKNDSSHGGLSEPSIVDMVGEQLSSSSRDIPRIKTIIEMPDEQSIHSRASQPYPLISKNDQEETSLDPPISLERHWFESKKDISHDCETRTQTPVCLIETSLRQAAEEEQQHGLPNKEQGSADGVAEQQARTPLWPVISTPPKNEVSEQIETGKDLSVMTQCEVDPQPSENVSVSATREDKAASDITDSSNYVRRQADETYMEAEKCIDEKATGNDLFGLGSAKSRHLNESHSEALARDNPWLETSASPERQEKVGSRRHEPDVASPEPAGPVTYSFCPDESSIGKETTINVDKHSEAVDDGNPTLTEVVTNEDQLTNCAELTPRSTQQDAASAVSTVMARREDRLPTSFTNAPTRSTGFVGTPCHSNLSKKERRRLQKKKLPTTDQEIQRAQSPLTEGTTRTVADRTAIAMGDGDVEISSHAEPSVTAPPPCDDGASRVQARSDSVHGAVGEAEGTMKVCDYRSVVVENSALDVRCSELNHGTSATDYFPSSRALHRRLDRINAEDSDRTYCPSASTMLPFTDLRPQPVHPVEKGGSTVSNTLQTDSENVGACGPEKLQRRSVSSPEDGEISSSPLHPEMLSATQNDLVPFTEGCEVRKVSEDSRDVEHEIDDEGLVIDEHPTAELQANDRVVKEGHVTGHSAKNLLDVPSIEKFKPDQECLSGITPSTHDELQINAQSPKEAGHFMEYVATGYSDLSEGLDETSESISAVVPQAQDHASSWPSEPHQDPFQSPRTTHLSQPSGLETSGTDHGDRLLGPSSIEDPSDGPGKVPLDAHGIQMNQFKDPLSQVGIKDDSVMRKDGEEISGPGPSTYLHVDERLQPPCEEPARVVPDSPESPFRIAIEAPQKCKEIDFQEPLVAVLQSSDNSEMGLPQINLPQVQDLQNPPPPRVKDVSDNKEDQPKPEDGAIGDPRASFSRSASKKERRKMKKKHATSGQEPPSTSTQEALKITSNDARPTLPALDEARLDQPHSSTSEGAAASEPTTTVFDPHMVLGPLEANAESEWVMKERERPAKKGQTKRKGKKTEEKPKLTTPTMSQIFENTSPCPDVPDPVSSNTLELDQSLEQPSRSKHALENELDRSCHLPPDTSEPRHFHAESEVKPNCPSDQRGGEPPSSLRNHPAEKTHDNDEVLPESWHEDATPVVSNSKTKGEDLARPEAASVPQSERSESATGWNQADVRSVDDGLESAETQKASRSNNAPLAEEEGISRMALGIEQPEGREQISRKMPETDTTQRDGTEGKKSMTSPVLRPSETIEKLDRSINDFKNITKQRSRVDGSSSPPFQQNQEDTPDLAIGTPSRLENDGIDSHMLRPEVAWKERSTLSTGDDGNINLEQSQRDCAFEQAICEQHNDHPSMLMLSSEAAGSHKPSEVDRGPKPAEEKIVAISEQQRDKAHPDSHKEVSSRKASPQRKASKKEKRKQKKASRLHKDSVQSGAEGLDRKDEFEHVEAPQFTQPASSTSAAKSLNKFQTSDPNDEFISEAGEASQDQRYEQKVVGETHSAADSEGFEYTQKSEAERRHVQGATSSSLGDLGREDIVKATSLRTKEESDCVDLNEAKRSDDTKTYSKSQLQESEMKVSRGSLDKHFFKPVPERGVPQNAGYDHFNSTEPYAPVADVENMPSEIETLNRGHPTQIGASEEAISDERISEEPFKCLEDNASPRLTAKHCMSPEMMIEVVHESARAEMIECPSPHQARSDSIMGRSTPQPQFGREHETEIARYGSSTQSPQLDSSNGQNGGNGREASPSYREPRIDHVTISRSPSRSSTLQPGGDGRKQEQRSSNREAELSGTASPLDGESRRRSVSLARGDKARSELDPTGQTKRVSLIQADGENTESGGMPQKPADTDGACRFKNDIGGVLPLQELARSSEIERKPFDTKPAVKPNREDITTSSNNAVAAALIDTTNEKIEDNRSGHDHFQQRCPSPEDELQHFHGTCDVSVSQAPEVRAMRLDTTNWVNEGLAEKPRDLVPIGAEELIPESVSEARVPNEGPEQGMSENDSLLPPTDNVGIESSIKTGAPAASLDDGAVSASKAARYDSDTSLPRRSGRPDFQVIERDGIYSTEPSISPCPPPAENQVPDAGADMLGPKGTVASRAKRIGGSKRKKKGKNKGITDLRSKEDEDILDDPILGEGAKKKKVCSTQEVVNDSGPLSTRHERSEMAGLLGEGLDLEAPRHGLLQEARLTTEQGFPGPYVLEDPRSPPSILPMVEEVPEAEAEPATVAVQGSAIPSSNVPAVRFPKSMIKHCSNESERAAAASPADASSTTGTVDLCRQEEAHEAKLRSGSGRSSKASSYDALQNSVAAAAKGDLGSVSGSPKFGARFEAAERAAPALRRCASNTSLPYKGLIEQAPQWRPESPGILRRTATPPLRRMGKRASGDLRALRKLSGETPSPTHPDALQRSPKDQVDWSRPRSSPSRARSPQPSPPPPPVANERRVRSKDAEMVDVFDGFGEGHFESPRSPTRPHSVRRRQSMQVLELESKVDQLLRENGALLEARTRAEQSLSASAQASTSLAQRDAEIEALKKTLHYLENEVYRMTEVNGDLRSANAELASKEAQRYADLELHHADVTRALEEARGVHDGVHQACEERGAEIVQLREQLDQAQVQIRDMQQHILRESEASDAGFLSMRDESYFRNRCQQLSSHIEQWVLRFSKFSDMRACRLTSAINDEKLIDRLDNAVLDGSDVDAYLRDRVRRRDIFFAVTMNMIWEYIFTRYLFGMDREQRQKLKSLEKQLTEVGPAHAVRRWRAVTLTLLSKRDSFQSQRQVDTEAVVQAILDTLSCILPPPVNLEEQIRSQLRRVLRDAAELSIEMRTQRAEYVMLPPLQPEYDANGDLVAAVRFDASTMHERSEDPAVSDEDLAAQGAVVRVVLFPLVVKTGQDNGLGDEKKEVYPAQVLVAKSRRAEVPTSEADGTSLNPPSRVSIMAMSEGHPEP